VAFRRPSQASRVVRDFSDVCGAFLLGAGGYSTQAFGNRALWCDVILLGLIAMRVRARLKCAILFK
jgi:hypothetical protein